MKDEARLQTVIDLTDMLFSFEQPADNVINAYFGRTVISAVGTDVI